MFTLHISSGPHTSLLMSSLRSLVVKHLEINQNERRDWQCFLFLSLLQCLLNLGLILLQLALFLKLRTYFVLICTRLLFGSFSFSFVNSGSTCTRIVKEWIWYDFLFWILVPHVPELLKHGYDVVKYLYFIDIIQQSFHPGLFWVPRGCFLWYVLTKDAINY